MSSDKSRTTLQDIADRLGYGRSTISLALRNHTSLPKATRDKIQRVAREMGYQPSPLVSALMAQIRDKRKSQREQIGIVTRFDGPIRQVKVSGHYYQLLYKAIEEAATDLGYDITEFPIRKETPMLSGKRLSHILKTRNIHGLIFFPGGNFFGDKDFPELEWEHFSTVMIGYNTCLTEHHSVNSHYSYDIDLALQHAIRCGYKRIGLTITEFMERATDFGWSSRFMLYQSRIAPEDRIPIMHFNDYDEVVPWFQEYRPEVILCADNGPIHALERVGLSVPKDAGVILLIQRNIEGCAGVNPFTDEVGRASVELLNSLLQTNQRGLPQFARNITVKGSWVPGASFPEPAESSAQKKTGR
ncbi:LacI family DNA-binding transcriptional regulator [Ruficoccus sp. ZRK36]|uniref:LacI family DNA-binding transcriptional regulator n=1 Tax=Ruficoccus sp. ZRK36 TaxID=2866311 RepID=UPI001C733AE6|nr:LacI family DNA-binding transcriptional regulator [Ruficoccus sp. ZRK36]QYY34512.1 LacI family transcriptional regulator [Ruficoccus sp. ZRK36]